MERFIELFKEALDREDPVQFEDEFRNYDEWNSIAYLSTIAMLNEEYEVQMSLERFKQLKTVQDIFNVVNRKQ